MTWIYDQNGKRWVDPVPRKTRKAPRALKFGEVKVGDQIMQKPRDGWDRGTAIYYVVTDLWFDPVEGQKDPLKGSMVGFAHIKSDGTYDRKSSTTVRGLASQQYDFADVDYIALCTARNEAFRTGEVIGIGHAKTIRARPKISGL
jgi:hypothetical protein